MFRFFYDQKWWPWSIGGTLTIVLAVWYSVQLDVQINEWFGRFYGALQLALSEPGALSIEEFNSYMFEFFSIAGVILWSASSLTAFWSITGPLGGVAVWLSITKTTEERPG